MTLRRTALVALAMTGALLAGCGSDDSDADTDPTPSAEETTDSDKDEAEDDGERVGTDDFTFVLPEGWEDISDRPAAGPAEVAYADSEVIDDFQNNINVIRTPGVPDYDVDELEDQAISELEAAGIFENVTAQDNYEVDGVDVPVVSAEATTSGITYVARQYYALHDDALYVITVSFAPSVSEDDQQDIAEDLVDTWRWEN